MIKNIILTIVASFIGLSNIKIEQNKSNPSKNKIFFYKFLVILLVLLQIYQIIKNNVG